MRSGDTKSEVGSGGGSGPAWRPEAGKVVPRRLSFRLERLLGQGGFGEVWLARHTETDELRVFKFCFEIEQVEALQRETVLIRLLKDELGVREDIARILDWSFESEPYFIELEFSSGGDLQTWSEAQGGLEKVEIGLRLKLICQIADALAAAHSVGVLHKDVKPGNILVHSDGGELNARLTDFGIGQATHQDLLKRTDVATPDWPSPGSGLETAATELYRAPELVEGRVPTVQADVYALGVVLYQVVIGDFSRALASGWQRDVDDELMREVIADACDGRPERRLSGAAELATRLRGLEQTRQDRETQRRLEQDQANQRSLIESWHRRRRAFARAAILLILFSGVMWGLGRRIESEVARAERELETATTASDFLIHLFEGADDPETQGVASVEALLSHGARRAREQLVEQPAVQARLLSTIGGIQFRLGAFDEGRVSAEKSLEIRQAFFGEDHLVTAESLLAAGGMNIITGKIDQARSYLTQCLEIRERILGPLDPAVAVPLRQLGSLALRENRLEDADLLYRRAIAILERVSGHEGLLGLTLGDLAGVYLRRDLTHEAIEYLRRAKALLERHLTPDHPTLGQLYATLGDAYSTLEIWDEAEPILLKAQDIFEPRLGGSHPYVGAILSSLGRVYWKQGDLDASERALRRSIAIVEPAMGMNNLYLSSPLISLGRTLTAKGELDDAIEIYDRALSINEQHLNPDDPRIQNIRDLRSATLAARDAAP